MRIIFNKIPPFSGLFPIEPLLRYRQRRRRGMGMEVEEFQIRLGRRIRALRLRRELTQEALGEQAGVNYKYLGAVERGERNPSVKQLRAIAAALGVELQDLVVVEQEELSLPKLRAMIGDLLKEADRAELQVAYKFLKALLR
jgi:transcriptional regulator with XRE-family HTH domain